jgi:hypothetical protein
VAPATTTAGRLDVDRGQGPENQRSLYRGKSSPKLDGNRSEPKLVLWQTTTSATTTATTTATTDTTNTNTTTTSCFTTSVHLNGGGGGGLPKYKFWFRAITVKFR